MNYDLSPDLLFSPTLNASASFSKHPGQKLENNSRDANQGVAESVDEDFKHPILERKQNIHSAKEQHIKRSLC